MLSEDKIRLMTRLSLYEKREGKRSRKADDWFKSDYIVRQVLITFVCSTIAFVIIAFGYAVYHLDTVLASLGAMQVNALVRTAAMRYIPFEAVMQAITIAVYVYRYNRAYKGLRGYYRLLRKLTDGSGKDSDRQ